MLCTVTCTWADDANETGLGAAGALLLVRFLAIVSRDSSLHPCWINARGAASTMLGCIQLVYGLEIR